MNVKSPEKLIDSEPTSGPWRWFGNTQTKEIYLATVDRGRQFVMDFVRWRRRYAQPRFQVHDGKLGIMVPSSKLCRYEVAKDIVGIHNKNADVYRQDITEIVHPDARLIALAPEFYSVCKRAVETNVVTDPALADEMMLLLNAVKTA